jgi:hypothetical protein
MLTYYAAQLGIALSVVDSCHPEAVPAQKVDDNKDNRTSLKKQQSRCDQLSAR